ncbi:hypothetical protein SH449x_002310 [Pirellulaceae bacterium SH449]
MKLSVALDILQSSGIAYILPEMDGALKLVEQFALLTLLSSLETL